MKAVFISSFGSPADVECREVADPTMPIGSQVLVHVRAAGLNRADLLQARGLYPPPDGYSPNIPGLEFAGEVAKIGDRVTKYSVGDRVFGITVGEAQAELALIDESLLALIPDNLSFVEAAVVPEAFITAQDAIFSLGGLAAGETLLIHAVGSGVGLAALQLAKTAGVRVIGTSRTADKLNKCLDFGLDETITTTEPIFSEKVVTSTDGKGVDVILDLVGGAYFQENLRSLAIKGRLILVGLTSGRSAEIDLGIILQKRAAIIGTVLRPRASEEKAAATHDFEKMVVPLLESGRIRPNLDRVFPAAGVVAAYEYLASNASFGKVAIEF
jgi:putative PIG3 family NAD(P)H quinone oxidoreductase